jgi:hypothetical protein
LRIETKILNRWLANNKKNGYEKHTQGSRVTPVILLTGRQIAGEFQFEARPGKMIARPHLKVVSYVCHLSCKRGINRSWSWHKMRPHLGITEAERSGGMAQVVEILQGK